MRIFRVVAFAAIVALSVAPSFAATSPRVPKKLNPIVALLRHFAARVFDGGDMSVPRP